MHNILVVDDDERLLSLVMELLETNGFQVDGVTSASNARTKICQEHYDVMVVDWMMPRESGLDLIQSVRNSAMCQSKIPAIMLTALGDVDHKVQGFEAGFDDYLPKPFEARELISRINALIRRTAQADTIQILKFGNCEFNKITNELRRNKEPIVLSSTELNLLKTLSQKPNEPFSRIELAKKLSFQVADRTIDVQITRLRKKIGDNPKNPTIIKTIRNIGYVLCCDASTQSQTQAA